MSVYEILVEQEEEDEYQMRNEENDFVGLSRR